MTSSVDELKQFRQLGRVTDGSDGTDGRKSWANYYRISYSTKGILTLLSLDDRASVAVRHRVTPGGDPWDTAVEKWRYDMFVQYLAGGKYALSPPQHHALLVENDCLKIRVPRLEQKGRMPIRFSFDGPSQRAKAPVIEFLDAVDFLRRGLVKRDPDDRSQWCTFFSDGAGMASSDDVYLWARSPQLPFDMTIAKCDAKKIATWLKLTVPPSDLQQAQLLIRHGTRNGRGLSVFRARSGHLCSVKVAERHFQRLFVDRIRGDEPAAQLVVDRAKLERTTKLFYRSCPNRRIRGSYTSAGSDSIFLHIAQDLARDPSTDRLPVRLTGGSVDQLPACEFRVRGIPLTTALGHFPNHREVVLKHYPSVKRLAISPHSPAAEDVVPAAYLRLDHVAT